MKSIVQWTLFATFCIQTFSQIQDYRGYKVYRVQPKDEKEVDLIKSIGSLDEKVDFWLPIHAPGRHTDIMVPESYGTHFIEELNKYHIQHKLIIPDVSRLVEAQKEPWGKMRLNHEGSIPDGFNFDRYPRLAELESWLSFMVGEYPELVEVIDIGKTYENRPMKVYKIGNKTGSWKPTFWIDGGIHAREWITVTTVLYFISQLLEPLRWSNDTSTANHYLNTVDFYFLPVHNPDGYEYTHTKDRLWRKTRSANKGSSCHGTDANRNWGHQSWGYASGASSNPCSQVYHGESAFSESESEIVKNFLVSHRDELVAYLSIHSYSQLWMLPYGYTYKKPEDYDTLLSLGLNATRALEAVHGTKYDVGSISHLLYYASGGSLDWAYDDLKIKYSIGMELRDTGTYGFLLPANQILPVAEETWAAVKVVTNKIIEEYGNLTSFKN